MIPSPNGLLLAVAASFLVAVPTLCQGPPRTAADDRSAVARLVDSVAVWISQRNAAAIASRMPRDSAIVYVSDGHPIRGADLETVLTDFYSGVRSMTFRWDSVHVDSLGNSTWGATAWARISITDSLGQVANSRAIFTWTALRRGNQLILARAHKTTLQ